MHSESHPFGYIAGMIQASSTITRYGILRTNFSRSSSYIKIVAAASQGGQIINYSDRFTITGMTGSFPPNVAAAIPGGTTGPTNEDSISNNNGAAGAAGSGIPYGKQTGMTKYAPMVGLPPTKISAPKNPTPMNPTSAFTIVKTPLAIPTSPLTTITASNTFSVSSVVNTVSLRENEREGWRLLLMDQLRLLLLPCHRMIWQSF